jgi:hypothetical protein
MSADQEAGEVSLTDPCHWCCHVGVIDPGGGDEPGAHALRVHTRPERGATVEVIGQFLTE